MRFDFDEIIDRRNTCSIKYDFARERGMPEGLIPLWVADMDFRTPPEVVEALVSSSQHGIFGYTDVKPDYADTLVRWFSRRFNWTVDPAWLVKTPGVVFAVANAIRAFSKPGDAVLIQQPVYYPFAHMIELNERVTVNSPLRYENGAYGIDFDDFEQKIVQNKVRLFILCSPHNPVGRVWTIDELERMGEICLRHGVLIVSDEIHADFVYPGFRHYILANRSAALRDITITCTAPSKTFNLAGLQVSNIFIADPELRKAFRQEIARSGYSQLNTLGLCACQAAYEHGEPWLEELILYLKGNLDYARQFLSERLPRIRLVEPEGTYLLWLDFKALFETEESRQRFIVDKAGLWLDQGTMFGEDGRGFERVNIACPRSVLHQALVRLEKAYRQHFGG